MKSLAGAVRHNLRVMESKRLSDFRRLANVVVCGAAAISWISGAVTSRAQPSASNGSHFDVASIKLNSDGDYRVYVADNLGGRFSVTGISFRLLMRYGYDAQDFQITGIFLGGISSTCFAVAYGTQDLNGYFKEGSSRSLVRRALNWSGLDAAPINGVEPTAPLIA